MLPHKHTKEGVLNEKLALKKLLTYMKSVYKTPQKIKGLSDERKRKSIPLFNIVMPVLIFLMLFSAGKHGETTEKLYPWKNPKS